MDIYSILSSKPHNVHYLKRYVAFIETCSNLNWEIVENHHICPAAKDMFPEYKNARKNPWNIIPLSPRHHFIAHMLLWRAFPSIRSQTHAFWQMRHKNKMRLNSRVYESLRNNYRELQSSIMKGMAVARDSNGNYHKVSVMDPRYVSRELVPIGTGRKFPNRDYTNYRKPKSTTENMKGKVSVRDPNNPEQVYRIPLEDPLYKSGYYLPLNYNRVYSQETRDNISKALLGKPHKKCCCILCGTEVSSSNLHRHYDTSICKGNIKQRLDVSFRQITSETIF